MRLWAAQRWMKRVSAEENGGRETREERKGAEKSCIDICEREKKRKASPWSLYTTHGDNVFKWEADVWSKLVDLHPVGQCPLCVWVCVSEWDRKKVCFRRRVGWGILIHSAACDWQALSLFSDTECFSQASERHQRPHIQQMLELYGTLFSHHCFSFHSLVRCFMPDAFLS